MCVLPAGKDGQTKVNIQHSFIMSLFIKKVNVSFQGRDRKGVLVMDPNYNFWIAIYENGSTMHSSAAGHMPGNSTHILNCCWYAQADGLQNGYPTSFSTVAMLRPFTSARQELGTITLSDETPVEITDNAVIDLSNYFSAVELQDNQAASTPAAEGTDNEIAVKSGYTRTDTYSGFSCYHHNQSAHRFNTPLMADKPWRIGVELEVYARNSEAYRKITGARSNWFQCESDGSLHDNACGGRDMAIELKTIPLRACDAKSMEFWRAPMEKLKVLAKSKCSSTTGLHVHIGKEILGTTEAERQKTLAKLNLFYVYMVEDNEQAHRKNVEICGREQGYSGSLAGAKSEKVDELRKWGCLDKINETGQAEIGRELHSKCSGQRWDINIGNYSTYGTIEFRKGKGIISATRMTAVVAWWETMVLYCKDTPWNELNFDAFFNRAMQNPSIAYYFTPRDEEA